MSVTSIFSNNKFFNKLDSKITFKSKPVSLSRNRDLYQLIKTSVLCNNARFELKDKNNPKNYEIIGDPTESALISSALDLGISRKKLTEQEPRVKEISFTSKRKMMSIIRQNQRRKIIYSKGAAIKIISLCEAELINGRIHRISLERKKQLVKIAEKMESEALRVLGFAYRNLTEKEIKLESGLIFLGFIGMQDKPRPEVKLAIQQTINAGIKVKIITGDSALTAREIAKQIGMTGKIITGLQLEKMSNLELKENIDDITIFARINPGQKLRIVKILKEKGEKVAITGDGVNDVLALKAADIGIAMGIKGTDVAREVSDMVLTDDNFASIVKAIEQGRIVYDNSKKATKFLLASNFDGILVITYSILLRLPLPLLPLQILWINLITDSAPALALTKEKGEDVMNSKPRKEKSILDNIFIFVLVAAIIAAIAEIILFHYSLANFSIEKTRTIIMMTFIGFEAFFVFSCRSNKRLSEIGVFSNKWLNYSFLLMIALQILLIYSPLATAFKVVPLGWFEWGLVLLASLPGLVFFE